METYKVKMSVLILAAVLCLPTAVFARDLSGCFGIYHAHATASGNKKHKNALEQTEPLYFKAYQILKGKPNPINKTWEADWKMGKGIGTILIANLIEPVVRQSKIDKLLEECVPVMQSGIAKIKQGVR